MNNSNIFLALLIFLTSITTLAQTQLELNNKTCGEYNNADTAMNKIYQQVLSDYKTDKMFIQNLEESQRAWTTYRDAYIKSLYPAQDNPRQVYGSVYPMCECAALEEVTSERTRILRRWIKGTIEGDVCAGTIKVKTQRRTFRHKTKPNKSLDARRGSDVHKN